MSDTTKPFSEYSQNQISQKIYNNDGTIGVNGFIVGKIGHKIIKANTDAVTEDYSFLDGSTLLYKIRIVYVDATKEDLSTVERIA